MQINTEKKIFTHEGAQAVRINAEQMLMRSVMACMLWEDGFYEDGETVAKRIADLVPKVSAEFAAACAYHARTKMKLRHVPLLIVREMARHPKHKKVVGALLRDVIQRPDELTEFLSIYWMDKKQPLSKQVKKGLRSAFLKFNEYQFAKYNRDKPIKLRDVMFMVHPKPQTEEQEKLFKSITDNTMKTPDTWEVALSGGEDKKAAFERLMAENKLGALAFLRNLRNMNEAGISKDKVAAYASTVNVERVLPFRFISAARAVPGWESLLESLMLKCLAEYPKLKGKTAIVVDNSASMKWANVSGKSQLTYSDAACALAVMVREVCEEVVVIGFGNSCKVVPDRRGFALIDAIQRGPGGGTDTGGAIRHAKEHGYDRIIIITDEQSHTSYGAPGKHYGAPGKQAKGYVVNVATNRNGIGYGAWTHIDGWSESILDYIAEYEYGGSAV